MGKINSGRERSCYSCRGNDFYERTSIHHTRVLHFCTGSHKNSQLIKIEVVVLRGENRQMAQETARFV